MDIQILDIEKIKNYEKNPRINVDAVEKVKESIQEFGFRQPIVTDENMIILAGHTRFKASKELNLKKVPVHIAKDLSEAQKKAYRIMDNKSNEFSEWDSGLLKSEMIELGDLDINMQLTGFELDEINKLTKNELLKFDGDVSEDLELEEMGDYEQSNVKMIQLFLNTETEPEFKKMAQALQEKFGINNITDLMFKILKERYDSEV
tara:strand:+ start:1230 stop:1844 length:615 start_codon:yes stop_codon:yes gene_type:complete